MQLLAVGVIVIVAVIGAVVVLVAVNADTFPVPLAASPMAVLLLVQAKVDPDTGPATVVAPAAAVLQ